MNDEDSFTIVAVGILASVILGAWVHPVFFGGMVVVFLIYVFATMGKMASAGTDPW